MANQRNTFIEGMDQDTSKSKYKNTKYYKGTNIKVLTEEGLSSGSIENEDGNLLSFSIPDTLGFWKVKFNDPENPVVGDLIVTYTDPNTQVVNTYTASAVDSIEDLVVSLNTGLSNLIDINVKVIRNGEFIYIIPLDSTVTAVNGNGGLSGNDNTYEVEPQTGLRIIGWTTLRDKVILFTTNETSATPSSAGQIWKFSYNPITKTVNNIDSNGSLTLSDHLIYNNMLNFSTHWHIGTEAIGHYENSKTGRVYWTDEYNNLRTINALDPNLAGFSPGDLSIVSKVDMSLPVVTSVEAGGNLPDGAVVQHAYRLFTIGGVESVFSPVTNPIPLGNFDPTSNSTGSRAFEGDGDTNSAGDKLVRYTISGIDTSFNVIEHIAIVTIGSTVTIYKFAEEAVPSDGTLDVVHSDSGLDIPITAEEFAFLTRTFKRCKTITVKDKRLIAANVDTLDTSVEGFDTRAYRFSSNVAATNPRTALLNDKELSSVTLDASVSTPTWTSVPDEHDAINPYNLEAPTSSSNQYKYQTDGVTLGGEGLNVSYEFVTQDISLKGTLSGVIRDQFNIGSGVYNTVHYNRNNAAPINTNTGITLNGEVRCPPSEFQSYKGPTRCGAFTGYARGEVYRFGITFYDKSGNPYNVKWIGDIKIPEAIEEVNGAYPYAVTQGAITTPENWNDPVTGNAIGVKFDVDVSLIQDRISGYEIVRVKREAKDRTRMGTGIYNDFGAADSSVNRRYSAKHNGTKGLAGQINPGPPTAYVDEGQIDVQGLGAKATYMFADTPSNLETSTASYRKTAAIISPTTILRGDSG
jgi:hypothetical protein